MSSSTADVGGVAGWAVDLVEALGGPGAGLAIALENVFPPLPSEVILPLTGFTASQGAFSLAGALFWTTLGSVVGALALYGLGRWLGQERVQAIWARIPLADPRDIDRADAWFERHGRKAVFFGRMLPVFRSVISVPAGITAMPVLSFTALTLAGSLLWNSIFVLAGYLLGQQWHRVQDYAGVFQALVLGGVVVGILWWVVRRVRSRRESRR